MEAIAGILFGAIGAFIAIGSYVRTMRKDWQQQLEREIDRKAEAEVKKFAAERDFAHLKRNHEQLQEALKTIASQMNEQEESLVDMRVTLAGLLQQIKVMSMQMDSPPSNYRLPGRREDDPGDR